MESSESTTNELLEAILDELRGQAAWRDELRSRLAETGEVLQHMEEQLQRIAEKK